MFLNAVRIALVASSLVAIVSADSNAGTCANLPVAAGNGGRKVAIVVDSSGSNAQTDPTGLRVVAARNLNNMLVSKSEAGGDRKADEVTVIKFSDDATILYPLGDPAGAESSFDQIDIDAGTSIVSGVKAATEELSKSGKTDGRSGIVVLTDGQDADFMSLVSQIGESGSKGIRVSFGFLSIDLSTATSPEVLTAILKTGGVYSAIDGAGAQQSFINLVMSHGITNDDGATVTSATLLAGLTVSSFVSSSGLNNFTYAAQDGEKVTFNLTSSTAGDLDASVKDASGKELGSAKTDATGVASISVDVAKAGELELLVTATNKTSEALFSIGVSSSLGVVNCTLPGHTTNSTTPPPATNGTGSTPTTPTHPPSKPSGSGNASVPVTPPVATGSASAFGVGYATLLTMVSALFIVFV